MLKRIFTITLLCLPLIVMQAEETTSVTYKAWKSTLDSVYPKPIHYLGVGAKVGYSQFNMPNINSVEDANFSFPGGANAGLEFRYKLEYHALRFTAGVDVTYAGNSLKGDFSIPRGITYPDESMTYYYNFENLKEPQNALEVGIPLMMGANFKGFYAQAGIRLGLPVWSTYSTGSDVYRIIVDEKAIDYFEKMENHGLYEDKVTNKGDLDLSILNPQVAVEIGMNLDPWLQTQTKRSRGRNKGPQFKDLLHYELALYANVGVMNYRETSKAVANFYDLSNEGKIGTVTNLASVTKATDFADKSLIPWNVGVRFNIYYEFYDKPKKPRKPKVHKPKEEPVVVQDTVVEVVPEIVEPEPPVAVGDTLIMENLYFDVDKTNVLATSEESLDKLADLLDEYDFNITLVGHTDNTATPQYNQRLSEGRVRSVKAELVKRGIEPNRIKTVGKGQTEPIADNSTPEGRQKNRRVEVIFE